MAEYVDGGLLILAERRGDLVQGRLKLWLDIVAVVGEGDPRRHPEHDVVALTDDLDPGSCGFAAKFGFLPVHILADRGPGEAADPGPDDRFGSAVTPADEVADQIAAEHAADCSKCGVADPAVARFGVGNAGRGCKQGAHKAEGSEVPSNAIHGLKPPNYRLLAWCLARKPVGPADSSVPEPKSGPPIDRWQHALHPSLLKAKTCPSHERPIAPVSLA